MWEVERFDLFLYRGINAVHKFLCMCNVLCMHVTCRYKKINIYTKWYSKITKKQNNNRYVCIYSVLNTILYITFYLKYLKKVYSFSVRIGSRHWVVFFEIKISFSLILKIYGEIMYNWKHGPLKLHVKEFIFQ